MWRSVYRRRHGPRELREVRQSLPGRQGLRRRCVRHDLHDGPHGVRGRLHRHEDRSRELRRLRQILRRRCDLRQQRMRVPARPIALQRSVRRPRGERDELRRLREDLRGGPSVRCRDVRGDVRHRPHGLHGRVRAAPL